MPHVVIIGAGPSGLELSQRLYKAGIRDQIIFDPRAGQYTRPGHLNFSTFYRGIQNISSYRSNGSVRAHHIKDLERALYGEVKSLGILVENKKFIGLHQDSKNPGVIVGDNDGNEEVICADYVFDCTGAKRSVISSVNELIPEVPFKMTDMGQPVIKKHVVAYVNMDEASFNQFSFNAMGPDSSNAATFTESLLKLRALGWNEFKFPRAYGQYFGKNKVCLYFCAPESLTEEKIDQWIQASLECYLNPIQFQRIPPSSKHLDKPSNSKPRVVLFSMPSQALTRVSYQGKELPMVIAVGDAQIDFDYFLAHGIEDGFDRINGLLRHIEVLNNHIAYFDAEDLTLLLQGQLKEHTWRVVNEQNQLRQQLEDAIESAALKLSSAVLLPEFQKDKQQIQALIDEAQARSNFISARNKMKHFEQTPGNPLKESLYDVHDQLLKALHLPLHFESELAQVDTWLNRLSILWRTEGNEAHKRKQYDSAIAAYKKALEACQATTHKDMNILQDQSMLYSNLAIAYNLSHLYSEAIASANMALELLQRCVSAESLASKKEKIVFNLIKALCAQANYYLNQNELESASLHHRQAKETVLVHQKIFQASIQDQISSLMDGLEKNLSMSEVSLMLIPSPSKESLVSYSLFQESSIQSDLPHVKETRGSIPQEDSTEFTLNPLTLGEISLNKGVITKTNFFISSRTSDEEMSNNLTLNSLCCVIQ